MYFLPSSDVQSACDNACTYTCRSQREAAGLSVALRPAALRQGLTEQKHTVHLGLLPEH